jgi:hypothetical protein
VTFHHGNHLGGHFTVMTKDRAQVWWYCDGFGKLHRRDSYDTARTDAERFNGVIGTISFIFYSRIA